MAGRCRAVRYANEARGWGRGQVEADPGARIKTSMRRHGAELALAVVPVQSCFIGLPRAFVQEGNTTALNLRLSWQGDTSVCEAHVGWGGSISASGTLEMPAALAEALQIRSPLQLRVDVVHLPTAVSVSLRPERPSDWETAVREVEELESQVLTQLMVVDAGQRLPLWLGCATCIWLCVLGTNPSGPAVRLGPGTEFQIAPFCSTACVTATPLYPKEQLPHSHRPASHKLGRQRRLRIGTVPPCVDAQPFVAVHAATMQRCGWVVGQPLLLYTCRFCHRRAGADDHMTATSCIKGCTTTKKQTGSLPHIAYGYAAVATECSVVEHAWLPPQLIVQLGLAAGDQVNLLAISGLVLHAKPPAKVAWLRPIVDGSGSSACVLGATSVVPSAAVHGGVPNQAGSECTAFRNWLNRAAEISQSDAPLIHRAPVPVGSSWAQLCFEDPDMPPPKKLQLPKTHLPLTATTHARTPSPADAAGCLLPRLLAANAHLLTASPVHCASSTARPVDLPEGTIVLPPPLAPLTLAAAEEDVEYNQSVDWLPAAHETCVLTRACEMARGLHAALQLAASQPPCGELAGTLVTADRGIGKTTLLRSVAQSLALLGNDRSGANDAGSADELCSTAPLGEAAADRCEAFAWTVWLPASLFNGLKPAAALARLQTACRAAIAHAPALLVMDDIDSWLLPSADRVAADRIRSSGATVADSASRAWLGEATAELLGGLARATPPVAFLASATTSTTLHPALLADGLVDTHVALPPLDHGTRASTLQLLATQRRTTLSRRVRELVAEVTKGCATRDLDSIVERAALRAALRNADGYERARYQLSLGEQAVFEDLLPLQQADGRHGDVDGISAQLRPQQLKEADFMAALPHVTSTAIGIRANVGDGAGSLAGGHAGGSEGGGRHLCGSSALGLGEAKRGTTAGWAAVGGLQRIKRMLSDAVLLPCTRPELFAAAPLRLVPGVLLYGPSGCGKTLLAAALAAESRLPLVSVKGAELLNKYIGASEAAVRALFERAAACTPCLLFFDEFEAIAPRRGHDSTGVTDRVVNQLLCQLDGVDRLEGVFLLAASNRPELIDPSLLRPGRLDCRLRVPTPDQPSRAAILETLCTGLYLSPKLRAPDGLAAIAARCEGFTGADLHGLAYAAQLAGIHAAIAHRGGEGGGGGDGRVSVTHNGSCSADVTDGTKSHSNHGSSERGIMAVSAKARRRLLSAHVLPWLLPSEEWWQCGAQGAHQTLLAKDKQCACSVAHTYAFLLPAHFEEALRTSRASTPAHELAAREAADRAFAGCMVEHNSGTGLQGLHATQHVTLA